MADPGGANPAMAPHQSWQWSLAPLGGRNSNGRIVNLCQFKDFGPPKSMWATDLAPLKKKKKKGGQKFWEIDEIFWENA